MAGNIFCWRTVVYCYTFGRKQRKRPPAMIHPVIFLSSRTDRIVQSDTTTHKTRAFLSIWGNSRRLNPVSPCHSNGLMFITLIFLLFRNDANKNRFSTSSIPFWMPPAGFSTALVFPPLPYRLKALHPLWKQKWNRIFMQKEIRYSAAMHMQESPTLCTYYHKRNVALISESLMTMDEWTS
jgi:hypothetical protein